MTTLDVTGGFDVHEHREDLKLFHQGADTHHLANRGDLTCPACGRTFQKLFVTTADEVTFDSPPGDPFCLIRTGGAELLLATH
jgi:hypothetical protein